MRKLPSFRHAANPCVLSQHQREERCSGFPQGGSLPTQILRFTLRGFQRVAWFLFIAWRGALLARMSGTVGEIPRRIIWTKEKGMLMRTNACLLAVALACGVGGTVIPITSSSGEIIQRTVHGTVVATNVEADPPIIVVEVTLPNQEKLVVGARMATDTKIMKRKQAAQLADIQGGEKADLTYLKTPDGLIARSIHVR